MRKPIKREWRHMEADEKIELLRADSIRLFALGNDRDAKIEELKRRIERIERFLSTLGER